MTDPEIIRTLAERLKWTREEAIEMCRAIEAVCPKHGCHVALTGGLLYKDGPRKDCDILFYRIRQWECIDEDLWAALEPIGLKLVSGFGWCFKAEWNGKPVDCFFPEEQTGEYITDELQEQEATSPHPGWLKGGKEG